MSNGKIYLVTGPVHSGKTTRLMEWCSERNDVFGILTPVMNGKRFFMNAKSKNIFLMEAHAADKDVLKTGKYIFSLRAFHRARKILRDALNEKSGWIVVDEIGPLELDGKGFCEEICDLIKNKKEDLKVVCVIREATLEKAIQVFGLADYRNFDFPDQNTDRNKTI